MPYTVTKDNSDGSIDISGTVNNTSGSTLGEVTLSFASFYLNKGQEYVIEFTSTNNLSDMYMFSPSGNHCNVKQSQASKITNNGDGTYTYRMTFTAGTKPSGADSSWGDGTYTGKYTVRFDQDSVAAGTREFKITDFTIKPKTNATGADATLAASNCAGNPTYCIALGTDIDRVQYAMVDKGKLYISRSWSRYESAAHIRELDIADININYPGTEDLTVNGQTRKCHVIKTTDSTFKKFGGTKSDASRTQMPFMGEALCVIDDYLYMFTEGAAYSYRVEESKGNTCPEPIDVIWKIDQYAIAGNPRPVDDVDALRYEKVNSISDIKNGEEYIIVHQSTEKDRTTQKNVLYALDSYGGYNGLKIPKSESTNQMNIGDSMGMVGYKITSYTIENTEEGTYLYIDDTDDSRKSIRWTLNDVPSATSGGYFNATLKNSDYYYSSSPELYFNERAVTMCSDADKQTYDIQFFELGNGNFYLLSGSAYFLWCNDGSYPEYLDTYTNYYKNHNQTGYTPVYEGLTEVAGTFHTDALLSGGSATGNKIGKLPESQYNLAYLNIYKRVPDEHTAVGDSKVYTDLKAEVQSDGSIDLLMETYATASLHYRTLTADRPTDFVLVMDTSASMSNSCGTGYEYWNDKLSIGTIVGEDKIDDRLGVSSKNDKGPYNYSDDAYFLGADGRFYLLQATIRNIELSYTPGVVWSIRQRYWAYYIGEDNLYYVFNESGSLNAGITKSQFDSNVSNDKAYSGYSTQTQVGKRSTTTIYTGPHYRSGRSVDRLRQAKNFALELTNRIATNAAATGFDHRVAICKVSGTPGGYNGQDNGGAYTGFYNTENGTTMIQHVTGFKTQDGYDKAFFSISNLGTIRSIINGLTTNGASAIDYGMHMASEMIDKSGYDYTYTGSRSACVILITDGGVCVAEGGTTESGAGANSASNSAVMNAYETKQNGTLVYSVRVGEQDISGFDEAAFLSHISMNYIDAQKNTTNYGDANMRSQAYSIAFGTEETTAKVSSFLDTVIANNKYSLARLNTSAVVREKLNASAFSLEGAKIEAGTVNAYYDGAMRLTFEDDKITPLSTTPSLDTTTGEFIVTGFDFSKNFVSQSNAAAGNAKKLVIRVKDVKIKSDVANNSDVTNDIVNVGVSELKPTGIFQNQSYMEADNKHKDFPEERLIIPQYTYVLDYGIGMLDVDINGTLKSVDTTFQKQSSYSTTKAGAGTRLQFTNNNQDMIYSIDQGTTQLQRYYVLIQRPNGEYDWFAINIVPASTVYYEENIFSNYISGNTRWSRTGNATVTNQGISLWDDVYGYDEKYLADTSNNSGGTVLTTTVSSGNKQSDTYRTNFIGDAFDLYSACGDSTGILVVGVRKNDGTNNGRGTLVKSYVVDTFYNDSAYGTLYQVPVIHCEDLAYGNYFVEITSAYLSISGKLRSQSIATEIIDENGVISYTSDFTNDTESVILEELGFAELDPENTEFIWYSEDSVLNGGMGAQGVNDGSFTTQADDDVTLTSYIDGLRAYNPTNGVSSYYKAEEQDAKYYNVFDNMKAGTFTGNGVSYLLGGTAGGTTLNFATELESLFQGRPKNEVYLENGNKITFTVNGLDTDSRVMVSLRAAAGTPKARVNNKQFNVTSKMEMYYDVTDYVTKSSDGKSATVIIENVSGGMLAIDNIKLTGKETTLSGQSLLSDIIEICAEPVEEVVPNQPKPQLSENSGEIPAPPEVPDNNNPEDGDDDNNNDVVPPSDDNNNPEEPVEDGFFTKVESFFVEIFNFFKNIFNKVSSFFKF